jgi:lysozyme
MLPFKNLLTVLILFLLISCCKAVTGSGTETTSDSEVPVPASDQEPTPTPTTAVLKYEGIDVSHFQGAIDWTGVQGAGKKLVLIKATEGIDLLDPQFNTNWQGAKAAGLVRGAYHFFVPEDDPTTQAEFFITNVQLSPGDMTPALDVEYSKDVDPEILQANVKIWLETVETAYGITPMIYTDVNFANEFLSSSFGKYPLWIASFEEEAPTVEGSWVSWDIWQYSERGNVAGIEGAVDLDVFQGTEAQWQGLLVADPK